MTRLVFAVLFALNFLVLPGEGQISPESDTIYATPGQNVTIVWKVDGVTVVGVTWKLLSKNGSFAEIGLIGVTKNTKHSPGPFTIKRPYILILENVTMQYNGTYRFSILVTGGQTHSSDVTVIIPEKPNVTISCSSSITRNKGDDVICVCRGVGGNPPADVTWYKGDVKIDETKKEINTLTLKNVSQADGGNYTCLARSYPDPMYEDNETIVVRVYSKPKGTTIKFSQNPGTLGNSITIKCESLGFPKPSYTITLPNGTALSGGKMFTIPQVKWNDTGIYYCTATNAFGRNSVSEFFNVAAAARTTNAPITNNSGRAKIALKECNCSGTEWYIIVGSIMSGIIIGLFLAYILLCSRRRWIAKSRKPERHVQLTVVQPGTTEVDPTYQELDLTKMNKEDNYQSLRVGVASNEVGNDDDSNYTELSKARDAESNYQSLT